MTISDRIFDLLKQKKMSQKEFSEKTGIAQSSISDWKRKRTNPVSEKIQKNGIPAFFISPVSPLLLKRRPH